MSTSSASHCAGDFSDWSPARVDGSVNAWQVRRTSSDASALLPPVNPFSRASASSCSAGVGGRVVVTLVAGTDAPGTCLSIQLCSSFTADRMAAWLSGDSVPRAPAVSACSASVMPSP